MSTPPTLKRQVRVFAETTSVRGIPRALKADDKVVRLIWSLAVVIATGVLIWQVTLVVMRYLRYESTTLITEAKGKDSLPIFPDITICNTNPLKVIDLNQWHAYYNNVEEKRAAWNCSKVSEVLFGRLNLNITQDDCDWIWDIIETPSGYFNSLPVKDFGDQQQSTTAPLIVDCNAFDWGWGYNTDVDCPSSFKPKWDPDYYRCYTFSAPDGNKNQILGITAVIYLNNFNEIMMQTSSTYVGDTLISGVRVVVHDAGTIPDMKTGLSVAAGTETTITLSATKRNRLVSPWGDCTNAQYLDEEEKLIYSSDACSDLCIQRLMMEQCGCLSPYYSFTQAMFRSVNYTLCGNQTLASQPGNPPGITSVTGSDAQELKGFADAFCSFNVDIDSCTDCQPPCVEWLYTASVSTAESWPSPPYQLAFYDNYIKDKKFAENFADYESVSNDLLSGNLTQAEALRKLRSMDGMGTNFLLLKVMYEQPLVYFMNDKQSLTLDGMWASFGGVLSLWLGINIMTSIEFIEFLYIAIRNYYYRRQAAAVASVDSLPK